MSVRVDRRTTIKWVIAASAAMGLPLPARNLDANGAPPPAKGYGTDPDLVKSYRPGELWPLTLTPAQRRTATVLCDVIIPADDVSPGASAVGVVDFLDEWMSAPYPAQQADRKTILDGFVWLDAQSQRRFSAPFDQLAQEQQTQICDDICNAAGAKPELAAAAKFFALYRDLTASGFYTTPAGMKDLQYVGNVPLPRFDGPPAEVLRRVGLDKT
jgi:Gluconate 2-dehydrogenase subunit 3